MEGATQAGERLTKRLSPIKSLQNIHHSAEDVRQELSVVTDWDRAAALGLTTEDVGKGLHTALEELIMSDLRDGDRSFDIRLRLPSSMVSGPEDLKFILLYSRDAERPPVYLGEVASIELVSSPTDIHRDNQQRIVEVSASDTGDLGLGEVMTTIETTLQDFPLPSGYTLYDGGTAETLLQGQELGRLVLALAVFLVFVVMAVQYESLRNPLIILLGVPFAAIGVGLGIQTLELPLSMPL